MIKFFRIPVIVALLACLAGLLCSCQRTDGFDHDDFLGNDVCLRVDGEMLHSYSPSSGQLSFNKGRREFRAGTDAMSDYFVLTLSSVPKEEGQVVTGSLKWTTYNDIVSLSDLSFKVKEVTSDGKIWLWCSSRKINVVVRTLN